jgi:nucleotide-binding universal stress UspA family protein
MNEAPVVSPRPPGGSAELAHEIDLRAMADPLTGAAFAHGHLVVASGSYLLRLVPRTGRIVDRLETCPQPGGLAYDGRYLWQLSEGSLQQLDLRTGFVREPVKLDLEEVTGLECIDQDLLVLHDAGRRLARVRVHDETNPRMHDVSPPTNARAVLIDDVETGAALRGLTWAGRSLWSSDGAALVRVDPFAGTLSTRVALPAGLAMSDVAAEGDDRLWCVDGIAPRLRAFVRTGSDGGWVSSPRDVVPAVATPPSEPAPGAAPGSTLVEDAKGTFERVLVPVDFSSASRRALAEALWFKDHLGSEVHLLHLGTLGYNAEFLAGTGADILYGDIQEDARAEARRFIENVFPGRSAEIAVHAAVGEDLPRAIELIETQVRPTLVILAGEAPRTHWPQTHWRKRIERMAARDGVAVMALP